MAAASLYFLPINCFLYEKKNIGLNESLNVVIQKWYGAILLSCLWSKLWRHGLCIMW